MAHIWPDALARLPEVVEGNSVAHVVGLSSLAFGRAVVGFCLCSMFCAPRRTLNTLDFTACRFSARSAEKRQTKEERYHSAEGKNHPLRNLCRCIIPNA